ncbi:hypothetical protein WME99_21700 [Sorangium sp. So ce136]|uniref:hypothetical protein n=1 Tax=Sorangium sp. So ce136 TaxID=3133284 RepID=UPI003F041D76
MHPSSARQKSCQGSAWRTKRDSTQRRERLDVLPCGHFDLYVGPFFARNAESQADFLARQLGAGP